MKKNIEIINKQNRELLDLLSDEVTVEKNSPRSMLLFPKEEDLMALYVIVGQKNILIAVDDPTDDSLWDDIETWSSGKLEYSKKKNFCWRLNKKITLNLSEIDPYAIFKIARILETFWISEPEELLERLEILAEVYPLERELEEISNMTHETFEGFLDNEPLAFFQKYIIEQNSWDREQAQKVRLKQELQHPSYYYFR